MASVELTELQDRRGDVEIKQGALLASLFARLNNLYTLYLDANTYETVKYRSSDNYELTRLSNK